MAVRAVDGFLLTLAGVWARSVMEDGSLLETFSIVTSDAGPTLARIHHRMPVILRGDDADRWLDARHPADGGPSAEELESMLGRADDRGLRVHPVSTRVNAPGHDDPGLLEECPHDDAGTEPGLFDVNGDDASDSGIS